MACDPSAAWVDNLQNRVRSIPMPLQYDPHRPIIHLVLPVGLPAITSAPLNSLWPYDNMQNRALLPMAPVVAS
jgi:hypothetical protein